MNLKELLHERQELETERAALYASIEPQAEAITKQILNINDQIEALISPVVKQRRDAEGKPYGMINIEAFQGVKIKHDQPKRVKWDEAKLASIVEQIKAGNADPSEYVKISYKVEERKYSAWPKHIRDIFEPARTTELGAVKVSFEILEQEEQTLPDNVVPLQARG